MPRNPAIRDKACGEDRKRGCQTGAWEEITSQGKGGNPRLAKDENARPFIPRGRSTSCCGEWHGAAQVVFRPCEITVNAMIFFTLKRCESAFREHKRRGLLGAHFLRTPKFR